METQACSELPHLVDQFRTHKTVDSLPDQALDRLPMASSDLKPPEVETALDSAKND